MDVTIGPGPVPDQGLDHVAEPKMKLKELEHRLEKNRLILRVVEHIIGKYEEVGARY